MNHTLKVVLLTLAAVVVAFVVFSIIFVQVSPDDGGGGGGDSSVEIDSTEATGESVTQALQESFDEDPGSTVIVATCEDMGYVGYAIYAQMNGEIYRCGIASNIDDPFTQQCYAVPDNDIEFFRKYSAILATSC